MTFTTIAQVEAHQFVGCYPFDAAAFDAIQAFIDTCHDRDEQRRAMCHFSEQGMGIPGPTTDAEVQAWLDEVAEG